MRRDKTNDAGRLALIAIVVTGLAGLQGCGSDDGVTTSVGMSVGYGYGGYYGPGWYGGYYEPYPPVVVVPPGERPDHPDRPNGPDKPTTLPSTRPGGSSVAPARPENVSRPTSRPSARPATRPMPRAAPMRRR